MRFSHYSGALCCCVIRYTCKKSQFIDWPRRITIGVAELQNYRLRLDFSFLPFSRRGLQYLIASPT
ncbi:hypothetical protein RAS2_21660 [Phycisphaerae bacterium RAS2]|nr:hypothetical protein RAS2_21660 [Phycisphaerae bacterium RAS2]